MNELYGWIAGGVGTLIAIIAAYLMGHSKATTKAEVKATEERAAAVEAAASHQTTVSKEAAHVDQTVNNLGNDDVDKQLRDKWTR